MWRSVFLFDLKTKEHKMAKVLCVLYDDPVDGYPTSLCARRHPEDRALSGRPDAAHAEGDRLSSRASCSAACPASWACANSSKSNGHTLVVTSDKDGPDSRVRARAAPTPTS